MDDRIVKVCTEEQVRRAVPPHTSIDAIDVVCRERDFGVGDERLDIFGDDAGKGDRRLSPRCLSPSGTGMTLILERREHVLQTNDVVALTCCSMVERRYTHSTPFLSRRSRVPVTALQKVSACHSRSVS